MLALSIRQPFAELILRGIKTIEYRSRPTRIIGQRFWIYATKKPVISRPLSVAGNETDDAVAPSFPLSPQHSVLSTSLPVRSDNLAIGTPPAWMFDLAEALRLWGPDVQLPRGVIVGSAVIEKVEQGPDTEEGKRLFHWHLGGVERAKTYRKPKGRPQPVWFRA